MNKSVSEIYILLVFSVLLISCDNSKVEDIDGRVYKTVKIGNQIWMTENLSVTKFRNGDPINEAKTSSEFKEFCGQHKPAFVSYLSITKEKAYGKYYNWYAIKDPRGLAPEGWVIPSEQNWNELFEFIGGKSAAGAYLKSKTGWNDNGNGLDKYGFAMMPGGEVFTFYRDGLAFIDVGEYGYWWASDSTCIGISGKSDGIAYCEVPVSYFTFDYNSTYSEAGKTVRCIKNLGD